jgi:hypothetical protein
MWQTQPFIWPNLILAHLVPSTSLGARHETNDNHYEPNFHTFHEENPSVNLAEAFLLIFQRVAKLLKYGPDETAGEDWYSLADTRRIHPTNSYGFHAGEVVCIFQLVR